jgi:P-type E1-E2 ATPase
MDAEPIHQIDHVVMDYNGTLAFGGCLLLGVRDLLEKLSERYDLTVLTADTFGTAAENLKDLPLALKIVQTGQDKSAYVQELQRQGLKVLAVGNGRNDIEMFKAADLSIAVIGPEGAFSKAMEQSTVIVTQITHALGLLIETRKMKATLRP